MKRTIVQSFMVYLDFSILIDNSGAPASRDQRMLDYGRDKRAKKLTKPSMKDSHLLPMPNLQSQMQLTDFLSWLHPT